MTSYVEVLSYLGSHGFLYFLLALVLYYVSILLYSFRWKIILNAIGKKVPLTTLIKATLSSIFVNNITPTSRSGGEILRIAWISKKHRVSTTLATASVIYERIIEAFPILFLLFLGMLYLVNYPVYIVLGLFLIIVLLWLKWEDLVEAVARVSRLKLNKKEVESMKSLRKNVTLNVAVFLISSAVWALDVLRLKLITMALGLNLSVWFLVIVSVINFALGIVAFTPGGLGIVEGGLIGTLMLFGLPHAVAVSITLLERLISYVISSLVGFLTLMYAGGMEVWRALRSH